MDFKCKYFEDWNIVALMRTVADWIGENEINVSDIVVKYHDDNDDPTCSTIFSISVYYILE